MLKRILGHLVYKGVAIIGYVMLTIISIIFGVIESIYVGLNAFMKTLRQLRNDAITLYYFLIAPYRDGKMPNFSWEKIKESFIQNW